MTTAPTGDSRVAEIAQTLLDHAMASDPLDATLIGFRQYDDLLADLSRAHDVELAAQRAEIRSTALAIDPADLSAQDAITRSVVIAQTEYADESAAVEAIEFTVAAFPVTPSSILLSYLRMTVLTSPAEAEAYLQRLSAIPRYLSQAEERLREGKRAGLTPVARLVDAAIAQIDAYLDAEEDSLAVAPPAEWDGAEDFLRRRDQLLTDTVHPAYVAHREFLRDEARPTARSDEQAGLSHLPGGEDRYRRLVRIHTTTERTPEELHQIGLDVVASVHREFAELGAELFDVAEPADIFRRLKEDPDLRWSTSQEILDAAEATVRRAEVAAGDWFGRVPEAVCTLAAIPALEADDAAPAYYMPPSIDGSRPGTYYTNVSKPEERTTFDLESVAYHEAVPGHHFQVSIALEIPDLPMIRRIGMFTAYVEGWGLYSERLADEMGLYSSPLQRMGMLSADAWRATRLVVDTGLHAFGWSRQRALDYMLASAPIAPIDAAAEIDRYIAMPGQALAYMTGRLEIQALRARAEAALGDRFDIKQFHDVVLGSGALPLSTLGELVDAWIAERQD